MHYKNTAFAALTEEQRVDVRSRVERRLHECERARIDVRDVMIEVMMSIEEGGYVVALAVEPPKPAPVVGDILRDALKEAYKVGRTPTVQNRFHHWSATTAILTQIDAAGFAITPKPVEGTAALLTPEGERIVTAIAAGDFTGISERQCREFMTLARQIRPPEPKSDLERDTLDVVRMAIGAGLMSRDEVERHFGIRGHDIDPRARAVRDLVEANRLITKAAAVLGHDAVDDILNSLEAPGEAAA